ncbi:Uncharacterised protein [Mycobacteroides abscessus subsp. abscessus]|nr:Uncharacterised protein [Mycobacteroides abscessus subsp. abscessus]
MCSARCERQNVAALGVCSTLPAPQINWRVTRNGNKTSEMRENSPARATRKFSWHPYEFPAESVLFLKR